MPRREVKEIKLNKFQEDLLAYVKNSTPLIFIKATDDLRLKNNIKQALVGLYEQNQVRYKYYEWTLTNGLIDEEGKNAGTVKNNDGQMIADVSPDPILSLQKSITIPEEGVVVFYNYNHFIQEPIVLQMMKDYSLICKNQLKVLIFTGAEFPKIPAQIEKDIVMLDFSLPSEEDLEQILSDLLAGTGFDLYENYSSEEINKVVTAAKGLSAVEADNAFALMLVKGSINQDTCPKLNPVIVQNVKTEQIKKSSLLEIFHPNENFETVGGMDALKKWLDNRNHAFSIEAKDYGLPIPKGILLLSVPGCGKSLLAKSIAARWGIPMLIFNVGRIFGSFIGDSERNIDTVISLSDAISPCILMIDEMEKMFSGLQSSGRSDAGTTSRVIGKLLSWMNDKTTFVFIVATCNSLEGLPPEMLRKGRFDQIFYIDLPNEQERKDIFRIHINKKKRNPKNYDLDELAEAALEFTGAEIEESINSAMFIAFNDKHREFTTADIMAEIKRIPPISHSLGSEIKKLRDFADAKAMRATTQTKKIAQIGDTKRQIKL